MTSLVAEAGRRLEAGARRGSELRRGLEPSYRAVAARTQLVTRLGWATLAAALVAWLLGARLGWQELEIVAAACLVALALAVVFTLGRAELAIEVTVAPPRVVVGEPAAGRVLVRNVSRHRLLPLPVELPVGAGLARFDLPPLAGGAEHEDVFIVPTHRRDVIPVGPATSVRSDPLGLLRREVAFSESIELFVHPRTIALDGLGSGFLRDLEGNTTEAISASDLAFHSLRSYIPGDDRRHVHWRTTAHLPSGDLMVRQFLDTRRSHLVVVLDVAAASYGSEDELELAISAAASLALRAATDEQDVTVVPGVRTLARGRGRRVLDVFSRPALLERATSLPRLAAYAAGGCADASVVLLATGSLAAPEDLRRAAGRFETDAAVVALVAEPGAPSVAQTAGGVRRIRLGELQDLPRVLQAVTRA